MGFSWVDRRLVREGHLAGLSPEAGMLYLFLVTVADRFGVSYYGEAKIADLTGLSRGLLIDLVRELIRADLVAYRHPVYQVLSLPADPGGSVVPRAPSPPSSSFTAPFRPAHQERDERRRGRSSRGEQPLATAGVLGFSAAGHRGEE
jgi:hypothetical protein